MSASEFKGAVDKTRRPSHHAVPSSSQREKGQGEEKRAKTKEERRGRIRVGGVEQWKAIRDPHGNWKVVAAPSESDFGPRQPCRE